ncbi:DNA-deoxyinosine glycosylase [Novosphingobium flavum]|uniref:DNA-deoxyinosine glycosylase n=1 Tax=Novosphingobium flavum TaxID=1778672 RepID=A0A7X1FTH7_9SPHN|nr:DNA-deoxyinosine glycosylase [Novosphingobium flavum]
MSGGRKHSFAPVADERTRLLILGSLPGEVSLAARQYYAHPRNQFWRLVGAVIGCDLAALPYETRLGELLAHRVGLWDVVRSGERSGSLDAAITAHEANPLAEACERLPALRALAFNGGTAARIGARQLRGCDRWKLVTLPSSSPAYCAVSFEDKRARWEDMARFLA